MIKTNEKGAFGYLDKKKKNQLMIAVFSLLMVAVICLTGIILYNTRKSLFAVLAALSALPAAKMLVEYLVIMPYHSVKEEVRRNIEAVCGDGEYCRILYDVVLSSSDKAMCAGCVFIKNGHVYGFTEHYKKEPKRLADIEKHIKFILDASCNYSAIKMFDDSQKFLSAVKAEQCSEKTMSAGELDGLKDMNERIQKQLKIYMF